MPEGWTMDGILVGGFGEWGHHWGMVRIPFSGLGLVVAAGGRGGCGVEAASAPATQAGERIELTSPRGPHFEITSPMEREIFQRRNEEGGVIRVQGRLEDFPQHGHFTIVAEVYSDSREVESQVAGPELPKPVEKPLSEASKDVDVGSDGRLTLELQSKGTGWRSVRVQIKSDWELQPQTVLHVGVGEVFVGGGQSNSTNWGEVRTKSDTGMVTVFDGKGWTEAADPLPGVDSGQGKGGRGVRWGI